jgi:hypothetical protein
MTKRKRTNNRLQHITQKTKDRAARTPLKTRYEFISTIRAYNQQERFIAESADCIDDHKRSQYTSAATSR